MEQRDHILIADDENEIRSLLRLYLENEGYEVDEAADGEEALKKIAGGDIHLCLLDIMMPKIDGFHVLKTLRETSNIPVIIVSAKGADPEKILGLDLGADDYIVKPFNPLEAVARVRSNLRRWHELNRRPDADGNAAGGRGAAAGGVSSSYVNLPGAARQPETLTHRDLTLDLDACCLYRGDQRIDLTNEFYRKAVEQCASGGYNAVTYELILPGITEEMGLCVWRDGHVVSGSMRRICDCLAAR